MIQKSLYRARSAIFDHFLTDISPDKKKGEHPHQKSQNGLKSGFGGEGFFVNFFYTFLTVENVLYFK